LIINCYNLNFNLYTLQWSYQAMVHELLTINNNQVDLSHIEDIKPDLQKLLLCAEQDDLYKQVDIYINIIHSNLF